MGLCRRQVIPGGGDSGYEGEGSAVGVGQVSVALPLPAAVLFRPFMYTNLKQFIGNKHTSKLKVICYFSGIYYKIILTC